MQRNNSTTEDQLKQKHTAARRTSLVIVLYRKLKISTAPTKAKSREPAYSRALIQNKIDRQGVEVQRGRQADGQKAMVNGLWSWDGKGGREKRMTEGRDNHYDLESDVGDHRLQGEDFSY